jgi:small-conductance mechanosensitive channel
VVEAFSLRSVRLRHHRGPLTTVPFGELGAVKNLNRDWTIDKISLNVTYDTDLIKAKRSLSRSASSCWKIRNSDRISSRR